MAMGTKSLTEVSCAAAVRVHGSLHKMNGVQAVEIGEAARVVKGRFVGNQHNVEIAPHFAQQPVDAACAAVSRWKNTERGDEQHARPWSRCTLGSRFRLGAHGSPQPVAVRWNKLSDG